MLLEVRVDNVPALALYERFGFTRMGLRKRYYQPEGIDAYTMSLDLEPRVVGFSAPLTSTVITTISRLIISSGKEWRCDCWANNTPHSNCLVK